MGKASVSKHARTLRMNKVEKWFHMDEGGVSDIIADTALSTTYVIHAPMLSRTLQSQGNAAIRVDHVVGVHRQHLREGMLHRPEAQVEQGCCYH